MKLKTAWTSLVCLFGFCGVALSQSSGGPQPDAPICIEVTPLKTPLAIERHGGWLGVEFPGLSRNQCGVIRLTLFEVCDDGAEVELDWGPVPVVGDGVPRVDLLESQLFGWDGLRIEATSAQGPVVVTLLRRGPVEPADLALIGPDLSTLFVRSRASSRFELGRRPSRASEKSQVSVGVRSLKGRQHEGVTIYNCPNGAGDGCTVSGILANGMNFSLTYGAGAKFEVSHIVAAVWSVSY